MWLGVVQVCANNSWQKLFYTPQMLHLKAFHSFTYLKLHVILHLIFYLYEIFLKYCSLEMVFLVIFFFP